MREKRDRERERESGMIDAFRFISLTTRRAAAPGQSVSRSVSVEPANAVSISVYLHEINLVESVQLGPGCYDPDFSLPCFSMILLLRW